MPVGKHSRQRKEQEQKPQDWSGPGVLMERRGGMELQMDAQLSIQKVKKNLSSIEKIRSNLDTQLQAIKGAELRPQRERREI